MSITKAIVKIISTIGLHSKRDMLRTAWPLIDQLPNKRVRFLWECYAEDMAYLPRLEIYEKIYTLVLKKMTSVPDKEDREELLEYLVLLTELASEEVDLSWENTK